MAHLELGWSSGWMTILTSALFQQFLQQDMGNQSSDFSK